jgi:hypothetical protein
MTTYILIWFVFTWPNGPGAPGVATASNDKFQTLDACEAAVKALETAPAVGKRVEIDARCVGAR